jgi:hypothetical protein
MDRLPYPNRLLFLKTVAPSKRSDSANYVLDFQLLAVAQPEWRPEDRRAHFSARRFLRVAV